MANQVKNRLTSCHADFVLAIVRRPTGWTPEFVNDVPPGDEVLRTDYVASYDEAFDDLVRVNLHALDKDLPQWAVIHHTGSDI